MALKIGSKAPDFTSTDQDGKEISLKDFKGEKVILYFYPKDNTETCTIEACNLRDNWSAWKKKGYIILGVSADSEKRHRNFISKYKLPFTLIADTDMSIIKVYDSWGEKQLFGRKYMGILRKTYVIDEKGKIEKIFDKVESKIHTEQILESYK